MRVDVSLAGWSGWEVLAVYGVGLLVLFGGVWVGEVVRGRREARRRHPARRHPSRGGRCFDR